MAGHRPLRRALLGVGALVLLASCSGDDGETTSAGLDLPSPTTEQREPDDGATGATSTETTPTESTAVATTGPVIADDTLAAACAGLEATLLRPIEDGPAEDVGALVEAIELLSESAPEPVRSAAATVLRSLEGPETQETHQAVEAVHGWALASCTVEGTVWACGSVAGARTFTPIGEGFGPDGEVIPAQGAATPEEVVSEVEGEGTRVEISRTDDEVVVAWLDADGHVVELLTVVRDNGWHDDSLLRCADGPEADDDDGFESVGGPIDE